MNYPGIGALILDATFDSLANVASYHFPQMFWPLVEPLVSAIVFHDVSKQVEYYPGPVKVIRRTHDEVMSLEGIAITNRTNFVLRNLV